MWNHLQMDADAQHRAETFGPVGAPDSKPTNPKDMVGVKKAPMSTVSVPVMAEVGVAMLEGALKYGRHNYRVVGVRASVYYDATMRHIGSWWEGEDIDPDSRLSHVTKAIASLVVLRDAMIRGKLEDDRPPSTAGFYAALNRRSEELLKRYGHVQPRHYTIDDTALGESDENVRIDSGTGGDQTSVGFFAGLQQAARRYGPDEVKRMIDEAVAEGVEEIEHEMRVRGEQ